jgi:hypothetical protein
MSKACWRHGVFGLGRQQATVSNFADSAGSQQFSRTARRNNVVELSA